MSPRALARKRSARTREGFLRALLTVPSRSKKSLYYWCFFRFLAIRSPGPQFGGSSLLPASHSAYFRLRVGESEGSLPKAFWDRIRAKGWARCES